MSKNQTSRLHEHALALGTVVLLVLVGTQIGYSAEILLGFQDPESADSELGRAMWENSPLFSIEGDIESGDSDHLQQLILVWISDHANVYPWGDNPLPPLNLQSSGGDLEEAMKIGLLLRKYNATAYVNEGGCFSSCVLILAGAVVRPSHGDAGIGVHRPYFAESLDGELIPAEYARMRSTVRSYLERMNIPLEFADLIFSVSPQNMIILSPAQRAEYLPYIDPAYEAMRVNSLAEVYGVLPATFRSRKLIAEQECAGRFDVNTGDQLRCEEAILHGVSRQVYLEWHNACEEMDSKIRVEFDNSGRTRLFFVDCPIPKPWDQ